MNEVKSDESGLSALLSADGYTNFIIKVGNDVEYSMDFEVFEVTGWECDEANTPCDTELYMTGTIKWDGCSHVWFGEKDENERQHGYLHLCGKGCWERHAELMRAVYALAEKTITKYSAEIDA